MPERRACSAVSALSETARPEKALIRRRQTSGCEGRIGGSTPMTCSSAKLRRIGLVISMTGCPCAVSVGLRHDGIDVVRRFLAGGGLDERGEVFDAFLGQSAEHEVELERLPALSEPDRFLGRGPLLAQRAAEAREPFAETRIGIVLRNVHDLGLAQFE